MDLLQPGDRIGDWIVVHLLGEGGMGAVYRARNAMSERIEAALKVIKPHSLADERARFIREVESLDALRHRAVVRVKGWGEDPDRGVLWLAMDLVRGEDLEERLQRGPVPPEQARGMFADIADGLLHAHDRGIFHRDIKPANIILCDDGSVRIVDFGIAVQRGRTRLTAMGMIPGTPAYMAPEIFSGEGHPDPVLLDVYALGQVLWESLTGQPAYPENTDTLSTGQALVQLMGKKLQADALDPGEPFPDDLREACRRATAFEPDDRYSDMRALHARLVGEAGPVETRWVHSGPGSGSDPGAEQPGAPAASAQAEPASRSSQPPPQPAAGSRASQPPRGGRRRRGLGRSLVLLAAALFGLLVIGGGVLVVLALVAGVGVGFLGGESPPPARDVQVALTGLPADTPVRLLLDGRSPVASAATTYDFAGIPPGPADLWVAAGQGCDEATATSSCPACCTCLDERIDVRPGAGPWTVAFEVPAPPAPGPRDVRISAPKVAEGWPVTIDLGGATGPSGDYVDAHTKAYDQVPLDTPWTLRVEAGRCPASARGCWPDGSCPAGCTSLVEEVAVPCGDGVYDLALDLPTPTGAVSAAPSGGASCRSSCPSGALREGSLPEGTRVELLAVHTDDAYCDSFEPVRGRVDGGMSNNGACWMGGGFTADDGSYYYFYKAAVRRLDGAAPAPATPGGRFTGGQVASGQRVEILEVHSEDAFYESRSALIGLECTATETLNAMEPGWYAGPVSCSDGGSYYFYKVAVALR